MGVKLYTKVQKYWSCHKFWNRRITKYVGNYINGAALAEEGEGKFLTYRENLGEWFFKHLNELKELGDPENVRIVFWFDN